MLNGHADGRTSAEIARQLEVLFSRVPWTEWIRWRETRDVARWLVKRGRVPNEAWAEAELEDRERTAAAAREASDRRHQAEEATRQVRRSRAALASLSRRLARAGHRIDRARQHAASQARREARDCKRATRRETLDSATIAREATKAAHARQAKRERADAFLRLAGPLVLAMRAHNRPFTEIAAALAARQVLTARGGPWTEHAADSVAQRIRARLAEGDGFHVEPENWTLPVLPVRPPMPFREHPAVVAFKEAEARYQDRLRAEETAQVEARRAAMAAHETRQLERADAKAAALASKRTGKDSKTVQADIARAGRATVASASKAASVRAVALPIVLELCCTGRTLEEIARELTRRGVVRAHGGVTWTKGAVGALLRRRE